MLDVLLASWGGSEGTAIELRRNGFFPILIVILLLISKNLSRARLGLGLRLRACQCGPAAGLNSWRCTPALSPRRGGKHAQFAEFSCPLVWYCVMGTYVGC